MKRRAARSYAQERKLLLIELRLIRLTKPARRVVKHVQQQMKKLRFVHKEGIL